jgi:GH24 family phage-related lysozyme (muramidase)
MNISQIGIDLIKSFEGCVLHAYKPIQTERYFTIGYGHYGSDVKEKQVITQSEAEQLLKFDLRIFEKAVNDLVKVSLNQNQFDSLVSFTYNVGREAFRTSDLLEKLNKGDYLGASKEFDRWVHSGSKVLQGLVNRRDKEKSLFLKQIKPPETKPKEYIIKYTIKKGDTLSEIALAHKTTVDRLLKLNPTIKNKNLIYIGQVIKIPN